MSRSPVAQQLILPLARSLKMPGLGRQFEALARQAREEKWSYEEFLHEALSAESSSRHEAAIRTRIHDARFPETKTLDDFDLAATDGAVTAQQLAELARCAWVEQASRRATSSSRGQSAPARRTSPSRSASRRPSNASASPTTAPPTSSACSSRLATSAS